MDLSTKLEAIATNAQEGNIQKAVDAIAQLSGETSVCRDYVICRLKHFDVSTPQLILDSVDAFIDGLMKSDSLEFDGAIKQDSPIYTLINMAIDYCKEKSELKEQLKELSLIIQASLVLKILKALMLIGQPYRRMKRYSEKILMITSSRK